MTAAPFSGPEPLEVAVDEHMALISEVKRLSLAVEALSGDVVLLRSGVAQNSADVLKALNAATVASGKCDLVLGYLKALRSDILKRLGSNGHG